MVCAFVSPAISAMWFWIAPDSKTYEVKPVGGVDTVTVNDLTGTGVAKVIANVALFGGGGDGQVDTVIVNGDE
jgi:hypothetical protein